MPGARERFCLGRRQQIRCDAGADGIVRMEEDKVCRPVCKGGCMRLFAQGKIATAGSCFAAKAGYP